MATALATRGGSRSQQTFAAMPAAVAAISRDFVEPSDTLATIALSEVVSAAACAVAAFTAAPISAGVGEAVAGCDGASFDTEATADRNAVICERRAAAAADSLAPAATAVLAPARVDARAEATREQLRVSLGYAAARRAFSPWRAAAVPEADEARSVSSAVFDLRTRDRAASVFSAAASAGLVVGAPLVADDDVDVDVVDVVVDDELDEDVVTGGAPASVPHPDRRQTASAVVTSVLRCMDRTLRHVVDRSPEPSSHPARREEGRIRHTDVGSDRPLTRSSERTETAGGSRDRAPHACCTPMVVKRGGRSSAHPAPTPVREDS